MNKQLDLDSLQALADERNSAGEQLADVAFNWSQQPGYTITSADCEMLNRLRRQWDMATNVAPVFIDRLRKAEAAREGWKLVPVEPTKEMWDAINKLDDEMAAGSYDGKGCSIEQAWNCLLAAAPDSTPTADKAIPLETPAEFALKALVAAGHVSQEKVDKALAIAGKFAAHTRTPTDSADSKGAKG